MIGLRLTMVDDSLDPALDPELPKNKRKFKLVGPRITSPQAILDGLGIPSNPAETASFEGLVNVMTKDPELKQMLSTFKDYLSQRVTNAQHPQFQRVLSHVESVMSEAMIRSAVRKMLEMKQNQLQEKIVKIGEDELYDLTDDNLEALRSFIRSELGVSEYDPDASRQSYIDSIDAVRGDTQFSDAMADSPYQDGGYIMLVIPGSGTGTLAEPPALVVADMENPSKLHKILVP